MGNTMNLNTEKYDDFWDKIKTNKQEKHICEHLYNEDGKVSCQKFTFCKNIKYMISGAYYDCD
jgi:hypothetical protein